MEQRHIEIFGWSLGQNGLRLSTVKIKSQPGFRKCNLKND